MKSWENVTIGDIAFSISDTHPFDRDKVIFLNTSDVSEGRIINHTWQEVKMLPGQAKKSIKSKDILYSEIRPANKRFAYVGDDELKDDPKNYVVSTKLMVIRASSKVLPKYLYLFLTSDNIIDFLHRAAEGRSGTFPQITFSNVKEIPLLLPSCKEQETIIEIIDSIDRKITLLQSQNQTLEKIAQTLFKHWFIDFEFPNSKGKPYRSSGGVMEASEFGEVPVGWKLSPLSKCVELIIDYRGKTPKKLGHDWSDKGIPAFSAKNIKDGKIVRRDAINYGSEELYDLWMKDELKKNDILLTSEAPLGEIYYLKDDRKYILSQRLFAIRSKEEICHSTYLYYYLKSKRGKYLLERRATGSTVVGIRQAELRKVEVLLPTKKMMNEASKVFASIFEKVKVNSSQIQTLIKTRDTLLPKLMSGQIRIKEFENQIP